MGKAAAMRLKQAEAELAEIERLHAEKVAAEGSTRGRSATLSPASLAAKGDKTELEAVEKAEVKQSVAVPAKQALPKQSVSVPFSAPSSENKESSPFFNPFQQEPGVTFASR